MTTHYSYELWLKYVNNDLKETDRTLLEDHLYTCDHCLELYMNAVDEQEEMLPSIFDETTFMEGIMKGIAAERVEEAPNVQSKRAFYQSSIFHYAIAACVTLVLMNTGVFQTIIKHTETIQKAEFPQEKSSEGLVNKTFAWIDTWDGSKKEEGK